MILQRLYIYFMQYRGRRQHGVRPLGAAADHSRLQLASINLNNSIVLANLACQPGLPCHSFSCVMLRPLAAQVKGPMVYSRLKFESGVHRVQRVCRPALACLTCLPSLLSEVSCQQSFKCWTQIHGKPDSIPHSEVVSHSAGHPPALSLRAHCRCPPQSRRGACTPLRPPWRSCRRWMMWRSTSTPR